MPIPASRFASCFQVATDVVVVVESPQTPEDDPEERLRTRRETGKFVDGLPKVQSPAVRVEGGVTEPQPEILSKNWQIYRERIAAEQWFKSTEPTACNTKKKAINAAWNLL